MKSLILLLVMVIFIAILFQTVFSPAVNTQAIKSTNLKESPAIQTLNQAKQLQQELNNKTQQMGYKERMKQH